MREGTEVSGSVSHIIQLPLEWRNEVRLLSWVVSLEQSLAWYQGKVLTGWSATKTHNGWRLIVKAQEGNSRGKERNLVAFYHNADLMGCFKGLAMALRQASISWVADRYPPDMGD